mmetsp:Transcript_31609/g.40617  ORF Transcript_31609/g.40617 Transcript_31609/m.40617 type:complete len:94 (-) Transcript_31609:263-544(-)
MRFFLKCPPPYFPRQFLKTDRLDFQTNNTTGKSTSQFTKYEVGRSNESADFSKFTKLCPEHCNHQIKRTADCLGFWMGQLLSKCIEKDAAKIS